MVSQGSHGVLRWPGEFRRKDGLELSRSSPACKCVHAIGARTTPAEQVRMNWSVKRLPLEEASSE